ncbi:hypothetical protein NN561_007456 [Cricetulus griseus]
MAKRRAAEPLTFRVPWKRLLLSDFPEEPPLWVPPSGAARSRKRQGDAGIMAEPAPAPRKRRGCGDGGQEREGLGLEPGEPPPGEQEETRVGRAPGGGDAVGSADSPRGADGAPIQEPKRQWILPGPGHLQDSADPDSRARPPPGPRVWFPLGHDPALAGSQLREERLRVLPFGRVHEVAKTSAMIIIFGWRLEDLKASISQILPILDRC